MARQENGPISHMKLAKARTGPMDGPKDSAGTPLSRGQGAGPMPSMPTLEERPRRRRPGCGLWFLLFLVIAGIGGWASWNFLSEREREDLKAEVYDTLRSTLPETLRAILRELMPKLDAPPPIPPINESGDGGVIPERPRRPKDGADGGDPAVSPIEPEARDTVYPDQDVESADEDAKKEGEEKDVSVVREDRRVRPLFVDDLASYVVERFAPGRQGGRLGVSVQGVNLRYGTSMTGLEGPKDPQGRAAILNYVFTPSMVRGIYEIYADSFLRSLAKSARARGMDEGQTKGLYQSLGSRCTLYAGGLEAVAATNDLSGRLKELARLEEATVAATRTHLDARFELEQARDAGQNLAPFEAKVDAAAKALQEATRRNTQAETALAEDIGRKGAGSLDKDTVLYLARWVGRRLEANPGAMESVRAASGVLRDLASRCAKASREGPPAEPAAAGTSGESGTPARPGQAGQSAGTAR